MSKGEMVFKRHRGVMRINREFSAEDVRYLHVSNEPLGTMELKMRQDTVVVAR